MNQFLKLNRTPVCLIHETLVSNGQRGFYFDSKAAEARSSSPPTSAKVENARSFNSMHLYTLMVW
jgi:hypothetical protein